MALSKATITRLCEIYLDENVIVFLKDMYLITADESGQEIKISTVIDGYLIDLDSDFVYLGLPDGTITRTISHDTIGMMEVQFSGETFDLDIPVDGDVH